VRPDAPGGVGEFQVGGLDDVPDPIQLPAHLGQFRLDGR